MPLPFAQHFELDCEGRRLLVGLFYEETLEFQRIDREIGESDRAQFT
jgi:hypothetical protein